ncbi:UDP-N-acetylglucosamine 1-carboxyvinyltransferase [Bacillus sp. FJAT-44742]|uniref:UDP-N-acetylglucosamine 1-carboxyvinyltransferase n=1 Tax=Bacillus sp. FJAT-44742 TaxID=2014005 RepID=UPI000C24B32E|nr:UDP-N-acetylglucosamine 1-carboxyvinyltransferase [Bacillus sp. FJAT-44742]
MSNTITNISTNKNTTYDYKNKKIVITGGNNLYGDVELSGAKNAALPMIVAACLGEKETRLTNVPINLRDVKILIQILTEMGANIAVEGNMVTCSKGDFPNKVNAPRVSSSIRYSLLLLGLTSALKEKIKLPLPGGCKIGDRKYDLHILGLKKLGVEVEESDEGLGVNSRVLKGNNIEFYLPTTSGTENILIAGCLAEGETTLLNANTRPEVLQLCELLKAMGAEVECKNRILKIKGVKELHGGVTMPIMPGWDEAITYAVAAGVTEGEIRIPNFNMEYIKEDVRYLRQAGLEVFEWGGSLFISGKGVKKPFDLFTAPYPGINSDMQPIFATLALSAQGISSIADLRFTDRFQYVNELKKFGANIHSFGNTAIIEGNKKLNGANVQATDLRGGASCILTGLFSDGETTISNVEQIYRGYENITSKLRRLGAEIHVQ